MPPECILSLKLHSHVWYLMMLFILYTNYSYIVMVEVHGWSIWLKYNMVEVQYSWSTIGLKYNIVVVIICGHCHHLYWITKGY